MKFWKLSLLTGVVFSAVIFTVFFTACEKNPCNGVSCQHGGSCNSGICNCPTGYEGAQCESLSTDRYIGVYAGYVTCDNLADVIDTVWITKSTVGILNVDVRMRSINPKLLHGTISSNVSTYRIIVNNNDSTTNKADSSFDYRTFTITLQSDKMLSVHSYEILNSPTDTVVHKCEFVTVRKL